MPRRRGRDGDSSPPPARIPALGELLDQGLILVHPFVVGEFALGRLGQRQVVLEALSELSKANVADNAEILAFIGRQALFGRTHRLHRSPSARLGSIDRRRGALDARQPLRRVADELGLSFTLLKRTTS